MTPVLGTPVCECLRGDWYLDPAHDAILDSPGCEWLAWWAGFGP